MRHYSTKVLFKARLAEMTRTELVGPVSDGVLTKCGPMLLLYHTMVMWYVHYWKFSNAVENVRLELEHDFDSLARSQCQIIG